MGGAFENLNVLDFTWVLAGPLTTSYLARHGATVVRVESTRRPDVLRTSPPFKDAVPGVNRSGGFAYFNVNKYSIALELSHPRGAEVAKRLALWADVVVENFAPQTLDRWGLGYAELQKVNPQIIMLSTSNQGQTGPQASRRGYGILLASQAGFNSMTGWPDRGPSTSNLGYTDFIVPRFAASALIAALVHRRRTGRGMYIDVSQLEASLHFLSPVFLEYFADGTEPERQGNASLCAAPHGAFRCLGDDRWCVIAVCSDVEWLAFCNSIGNPEWSTRAEYATLAGRKMHEQELNLFVEEWTGCHSPEEVTDLLQRAGVPAGIVKNGKDLVEDPQLAKRNHLWWLDHEELGRIAHMGSSILLSRTPAEPTMPAPWLGQHSEYVCRNLLGMSEEEFDSLLLDGALGQYGR